MMKLAAASLVVFATIAVTWADDRPTTVSSSGAATIEAAADRIRITFELVTERNSFSDAIEGAAAVAERLRAIKTPVEGVTHKINYDVSTLRQPKWSKGKKIEQQFRAELENVPEDSVQLTLVRFIDSVLQLEPSMTVESFDTSLSQARRKQTVAQALEQAVADARTNAAIMADSAGLRLEAARAVNLGGPGQQTSGIPGMLQESVTVESWAMRARAFTASGDAVGRIQVPVEVWVVFGASPK